MVYALTHTSVANCGPRAVAPVIDLGPAIQPWLTQTLRSIENQMEPLDSVLHHQACMIKTLPTPESIWYLACIMVPNPSESELRHKSVQDVEQLSDFRLIHIEASIIHADIKDRDEVAFKLTTESINSLLEYYEREYCVGLVAKTHERSENDRVRNKVREDFTRAIKEFVYRTHVSALEGLEVDGAGELLVNDCWFPSHRDGWFEPWVDEEIKLDNTNFCVGSRREISTGGWVGSRGLSMPPRGGPCSAPTRGRIGLPIRQ